MPARRNDRCCRLVKRKHQIRWLSRHASPGRRPRSPACRRMRFGPENPCDRKTRRDRIHSGTCYLHRPYQCPWKRTLCHYTRPARKNPGTAPLSGHRLAGGRLYRTGARKLHEAVRTTRYPPLAGGRQPRHPRSAHAKNAIGDRCGRIE